MIGSGSTLWVKGYWVIYIYVHSCFFSILDITKRLRWKLTSIWNRLKIKQKF